jgi:hypothetical protein
VIANEAKKHHYVPQFYMRRFACADDENKVMCLSAVAMSWSPIASRSMALAMRSASALRAKAKLGF